MNLRKVFIIATLTIPWTGYAQTQINKSIPIQSGQRILMRFDFPELIKVSTWDKNEISIQGSVSINNGENDDAFELQTSTSGNTVSIRNEIKNMKSLPHRYTVVDGSQKVVFKNREEFEKYQAEHGRGFDMVSSGIDMDILLEIKVPRNVQTDVESVHGMVEITDFSGPLHVEAIHGGVDAALVEKATGQIIAETNFGDIYTNLDVKFGSTKSSDRDFHTFVSAKPGTGPDYTFESKFGNVYIRKAK